MFYLFNDVVKMCGILGRDLNCILVMVECVVNIFKEIFFIRYFK